MALSIILFSISKCCEICKHWLLVTSKNDLKLVNQIYPTIFHHFYFNPISYEKKSSIHND